MTKKFGRLPSKRVLLGVGIGLFILGVGVYAVNYYYTQQQQKQVKQEKVIESERTKLDDTAFRGDRDVAAQYVEKVQDKQLDAAYKIYETAAQKLTDNAAKVILYEQAVAIANQQNQAEHALKYAVSLSGVSGTHRASANVAYLYGQKKDYENQRKYLQQAIDQLEILPKDSQEYSGLKTYYQDMLTKIGAN